jgi:hypothetical protein
MNYSEKELADIAMIKRVALITDEDLDNIKAIFANDVIEHYIPFSIQVPNRCNDRVRRNLHDYIDYLFPDPFLEDLLNTNPSSPFVVTVDIRETWLDVRIQKK